MFWVSDNNYEEDDNILGERQKSNSIFAVYLSVIAHQVLEALESEKAQTANVQYSIQYSIQCNIQCIVCTRQEKTVTEVQ